MESIKRNNNNAKTSFKHITKIVRFLIQVHIIFESQMTYILFNSDIFL
jgi:hypothetical protein